MSDVHVEGDQPGLDRRALVKRMAVGAFAVPAIVSFQLDSLARAGTFKKKHPKHTHPNQSCPNQTYPNQTEPNQTWPNQTEPNQTYPNQTCPNQSYPNQTQPDGLISCPPEEPPKKPHKWHKKPHRGKKPRGGGSPV